MKLNNVQRKIIITMVIVIVVMGLFPPFHMVVSGTDRNFGYALILRPPVEHASINAVMLFVQWVGVVIIGSLLVFVYKDYNGAQQDAKFHTTEIGQKDEKPMPIGGLLNIIICIFPVKIFSAAMTVYVILTTEHRLPKLSGIESWNVYRNLIFLATMLSVGYLTFTFYRIYKLRQRSIPAKTIISTWVNLFVYVIIIYYIHDKFGLWLGIKSSFLRDVSNGLILSVILSLYFIFSRRVSNTYQNDNGKYTAKHELFITTLVVVSFCLFIYLEPNRNVYEDIAGLERPSAGNYFEQFQNKKGNFFDQFDEPTTKGGNIFDQFDEPQPQGGNIFDQFDEPQPKNGKMQKQDMGIGHVEDGYRHIGGDRTVCLWQNLPST